MKHIQDELQPHNIQEFFFPKHAAQKKYNLWVDGSFLDKNRNKAGTGAVLAEVGDNKPVFALAYNISSLGIRKSKYTELWATALALEQFKDLDIKRMVFDSPITKNRINSIRTGIKSADEHEKLIEEQEECPELYEKLKKSLSFHSGLRIEHLKRNRENMPLADRFSRISAKRRIARIFSSAHDADVPCLYQIVNNSGNIRQSYFYDRMENYDINQYIEGKFASDEREGASLS